MIKPKEQDKDVVIKNLRLELASARRSENEYREMAIARRKEVDELAKVVENLKNYHKIITDALDGIGTFLRMAMRAGGVKVDD